MRINVTRSSMPDFEEFCQEIRPLWDSHWLTNNGEKLLELQSRLEAYLDVGHLSLFTNGHLALEALLEALDPEQGTIRIGFPSSMTAYVLPTVISEFRELYPNVKFHLRQGAYKNLIDTVISGEIDLAMLGPVPEHEKRVKGYTLFHENIAALLPSRHPLAGEQHLQLNQLQDDDFILFPEGFILREIVENSCRQVGFVPRVTFEGGDIDSIKGLVATGLGVTLIPEITLVDNLPRTTVKIPVSSPALTRSVGVITPTDRDLLPTEKIFFEFLKQFFPAARGLPHLHRRHEK